MHLHQSFKLALLISLAFLTLGGCASGPCYVGNGEEPLLRFVYWPSGDTPVVYTLKIFRENLIELENIGWRTSCKKVFSPELDSLLKSLGPTALEGVASSSLLGGVYDEVHIYSGEHVVKLSGPELPEEVREGLKEVDRLFEEKFGRAYDIRLARISE